MAWWLPLIGAALSNVEEENKHAQAKRDALADTLNRIRMSHAARMGADPSLGMATDYAISLQRHNRDYQPPINAVGAAIQAIGRDKPLLGKSGYGSAADDPFSYNPSTYDGSMGAAQDLKDPWDDDPWGDFGY